MKKPLLYLLFFLVAYNAQAQHRPWIAQKENEAIKKISREVTDDGYVYYREDVKIRYNHVFSQHKGVYGLSESDSMKLIQVTEGTLNDKHYRYQQYYKGVPVEEGEYLVHTDNKGMVSATNGHLIESFRMDVKPGLRSKSLGSSTEAGGGRAVRLARYRPGASD